MHFFHKNWNIYPCSTFFHFDVKELFFPLIFFYLNSEGFVGGRWRRWWNPPMNIFNSAKNGPFLEDKKKKLPKVTGTLYIEWVLPKYIMIQCFWPNILWKCPNFCLKKWFLLFSKIYIFGCFLGFLRSNWNSETSFII